MFIFFNDVGLKVALKIQLTKYSGYYFSKANSNSPISRLVTLKTLILKKISKLIKCFF